MNVARQWGGMALALAGLMILGSSLAVTSVDTGGMLVLVSPLDGGHVLIQDGQAQAVVHLEVRFGKASNGAQADPATFTAKLTGKNPDELFFSDIKDYNGNVVGKRADVTVAVDPAKPKKLSFGASVKSKPFNIGGGKFKVYKAKVKSVVFPRTDRAPVISNFRITNAVAVLPDGRVKVNGNAVNFQAVLSDPDMDSVTSYSIKVGSIVSAGKSSPSGLTAVDETLDFGTAYGDYVATLSASDWGMTATAQLLIRINAPPVAKLLINPGVATFRYPVLFDARDSSDPNGDPLTYTWDFGDGLAPVTTTTPTTTHSYPLTGKTKETYLGKVTVTDDSGASSTAQVSVQVQTSLTGGTMLNVVSPLNREQAIVGDTLPVTIKLSKASSGADPDLTTFRAWLNGIEVTSAFTDVTDPNRGGQVVARQAAIPAAQVKFGGLTNNLTLKMISKPFPGLNGYMRTLTDWSTTYFTATLNHPPTAQFTWSPSEAKPGDTVTFDASGSSDPEHAPLIYSWDFGDGSALQTATTPMATHAYAAEGGYTVTLTVSDGTYHVSADNAANLLVVRNAPVPTANPILTLDTDRVDFGDLNGQMNVTVWDYHSHSDTYPVWVEKMVELTNTGDGTLTVSSVATDNPAFQVANAPQVTAVSLQAGESYFVGLKFSPRPDASTPGTPGPYLGSLTLVTNAGTQTVSLAGNVVASLPADSLRLMRSDTLRTDPSGHTIWEHGVRSAAVLDMGAIPATSKKYLVWQVGMPLVNQGGSTGTVTGVEILDDQGNPSPDFSAQTSGSFSMAPGQFAENADGTIPSASYIVVWFYPQNPEPARRLSARMIIHTSGGDLAVGVTGVGLNQPDFKFADHVFEFQRSSLASSTQLGSSIDGLTPATLTVTNVGRKPGTLTPSIETISPGTPFILSQTTPVTLDSGQSVQINVTFQPPSVGHYAALLKLRSNEPYIPTREYVLHGFRTGTGALGVLGTSEDLNVIDDTGDFFNSIDTFIRMVNIQANGQVGNFGELGALQDPFMVGGTQDPNHDNRVDMAQYAWEWSDLAVAGGHVFSIDGALWDHASASESGLNAEGVNRLSGGGRIGSGALLMDDHFLAQADRPNKDPDVFSDGVEDPVDMDVTADQMIFYTDVQNAGGAVKTALKWLKADQGTQGVVTSDLSLALTGASGKEVLDLRAIQSGIGYRVFVIFEGGLVWDADVSSAKAITSVKNLTSGLSAVPTEDMRIDGQGRWYTVSSDSSGNVQVFREDLHNGGKTPFGQTTLPMMEPVSDVLVDRLGNVLLSGGHGILRFDPSGVFQGYVLAGSTFYPNNRYGDGTTANQMTTVDLGDFTTLWFGK